MSFKISFTGTIIGGPHDGKDVAYEGECADEDITYKMDRVEFDGHKYKIVEFDQKANHATLMW